MGFLFVKEVAEFIILTLAIIGSLLLFSRWVIKDTNNIALQSDFATVRDVPPLNKSIRDFNDLSTKIIQSGANFQPIIPQLMELQAGLPGAIRLTGTSFDRNEGTFGISGIAADRQALQDLINFLKKLTWLTDVTAPESLLVVQKTDFDFDIHARLVRSPSN